MPGRLQDRTAIVTGGASGIGLATARRFAQEGASVVVVDTETGEIADPVLVDRRTGKVMAEPAFRSVHVS